MPHLAEAAKTSGGAETLSCLPLDQFTHGCPFNQFCKREKISASMETIQASLQSKWVRASTCSPCKIGSVAKRHLALCRAKTCQDDFSFLIANTSDREPYSIGPPHYKGLRAMMHFLLQVVGMGQWQQSPCHIKRNLVRQVQDHFPAGSHCASLSQHECSCYVVCCWDMLGLFGTCMQCSMTVCILYFSGTYYVIGFASNLWSAMLLLFENIMN